MVSYSNASLASEGLVATSSESESSQASLAQIFSSQHGSTTNIFLGGPGGGGRAIGHVANAQAIESVIFVDISNHFRSIQGKHVFLNLALHSALERLDMIADLFSSPTLYRMNIEFQQRHTVLKPAPPAACRLLKKENQINWKSMDKYGQHEHIFPLFIALHTIHVDNSCQSFFNLGSGGRAAMMSHERPL